MFRITSALLFLPIFFFFARAPSNHFVCETPVLNLSYTSRLSSITQQIPHFLSSPNEARWGAEVGRKQTGASVLFFFSENPPSSKNLWCYPRPLSECRSHSITLWSSPLPLSAEAFSLRKPTGADSAALAVISGNREIEGESLPPLYCARVSVFQLMSCLRLETVGIWDTLLCNAIFKENLT